MQGRGEPAIGRRPIVYCLVPPDLAPRLHDLLRRHFRDDHRVEVIVEQRSRERRRAADRRAVNGVAATPDRRLVRALAGRRAGDRRAALVETEGPLLPRRAARLADHLTFVERLEPSGLQAEDADTARLVARIQAGDRDAFAVLYMRYFDRVYGYLHALVRVQAEAEDVTQQVFIDAMNGIHGYERGDKPFRAWLFVVARNHALTHLRRRGRTTPTDPLELTRLRERAQNGDADEATVADVSALRWISDRDLHIFIERLPVTQREILILRYMVGFSLSEIAVMLGLTVGAARKHHSRALRFLRRRLDSVGRSTVRGKRMGTRLLVRQSRVLRDRRFGLVLPR